MTLDIKTLMICNVIIALFFCMAFSFYMVGRKTQAGFRLWTVGILFHALGFLFLVMRGTIPTGLSILLANGLIILSVVLRLDAIYRLVGNKTLAKSIYLVPLVVCLVCFYFYRFIDHIGVRSLVVSITLFLLALAFARKLIQKRSPRNRYLYYFAAGFILIRGSSLMIRALDCLVHPEINIFTAGPRHSTHFLIALIAEVGINIIFLMMNMQQAEEELYRVHVKMAENHDELRRLSMTDTLTGLLNRRAAMPIINREMERTNRFGQPVSLIILDIDHFKKVNDTCGHDVGDKVLVGFSDLVRENCRKIDSVSRWGGEEFVIIASHTNADNAAIQAEKIRRTIMNRRFDKIGTVTISAGISTYHPRESFEEWFKRADEALYMAKENGRNRVDIHPLDRVTEKSMDTIQQVFSINWQEEFSSGNDLIDAQHRGLIKQSNLIIDAIMNNSETAILKSELDKLLSLTLRHFQDEEKILRDHQFSLLDSHAEEHRRFTEELQQNIRRFSEDDLDAYHLLRFVCHDLVIGHMINKDKSYHYCLNMN